MSRKFISSIRGSYNVHANEIARGMRSISENDQDDDQQQKQLQNASPNNSLTGRLSNLGAMIIGRGGGQYPIQSRPLTIRCIVRFLDDTEHIFEVDRSAKGEELMDAVFRHLELIEREYFALQYTETYDSRRNYYNNLKHGNSHLNDNDNYNHLHMNARNPLLSKTINENVNDEMTLSMMHNTNRDEHNLRKRIADEKTAIVYHKWLDPHKKIRKQMRFLTQPFLLNFRVKFYVNEMSRLLEEYTRYHFYLQLRKDILDGHLCEGLREICVQKTDDVEMDDNEDNSQLESSTMATLASYVLQSELGDYCPEDHKPGYSKQFQFIPNQTDEFCQKVESLHRLHQGQTPADAEINYLEEAKHLELYGVDLHDARDNENQCIKIGVSSNGLNVYKSGNQDGNLQRLIKINMFSWAKIVKISFKRRYFFVQLKHEGTERYDNMIGFNLCSYRACKSLWKSCVEQHTFFRLHTPKPLTKKFFFFLSLGSKFRYSGKTESQTIEENRRRLIRTERIFIRNNARNATMPASLNKNLDPQKMAIADAQKHIVNLKLSTIDGSGNSAINCSTNGNINQHLFTSAESRLINKNRFKLQQPQQSRHSPLSSMESSGSDGLSSSSASSLLGPSMLANKKKGATTAIIAMDKSPKESRVPSLSQQQVESTVLSTKTSSSITTKTNIVKYSSGHHQNNQKTINENNTSHNLPTTKASSLISSSSNTSNSSSSASLETSFMPSHSMIGTNSSNNNEETGVAFCKNQMKNDLTKSQQHETCDRKEQSKNIIINGGSNGSVSSGSGHTTIIQIGSGTSEVNEPIMKVCSIPQTFMTTVTPYTPSATLISSLPYIDSMSTASDKTSASANSALSNGNSNGNNTKVRVDSPTSPTITEDIVLNEEDENNDQISSKTTKQFDFDSPFRELIRELYDGATALGSGNEVNTPSDLDSPVQMVTITMKPDKNGCFGFNVKGGHDQNCPVLVSRVLPDSPADNATPSKLHEGDQVMIINGTEVAGLKHEQVVHLIKSTKDQGPDAKLVLSIIPNLLYKREEFPEDEIDKVRNKTIEESPFHYTATIQAHKQLNEEMEKKKSETSESLLQASMNLLREGLQEDSLIAHFDYLPRRNEDESITVARFIDNLPKNRYLDIAPYDSTRVVLQECNSGNYINASYVTMSIEASGVINRYIATQGPLKRTTSDFWQMVWEKRSTLIVMVTPLIEDGRKKCFKYWPDEGQTMIVNDLFDLTQEDCQDRGAFLERTFKITDPETKETHYVTHLQYLAWPDQGVPDDDTDFLKLIFKVRELRGQDPNDSPVIVHCSAGIGRTGVLILMETGICLIEANQPVYPLELVRVMRNQRAMLIQTSTQFRFVCEALHRVYRDRLICPLEKYVNAGKEVDSKSKDQEMDETSEITIENEPDKQESKEEAQSTEIEDKVTDEIDEEKPSDDTSQ